MKVFIRIFGLKGSWKWAIKQLRKGKIIRPSSATGAVKYRLDTESQGRIQWTFKHDPQNKRDWKCAKIFLSDFTRIDWEIL